MNVDDKNFINLILAYTDYRLYSLDRYDARYKVVALEIIEEIYLGSSYIVRSEFKTLFRNSLEYELVAVFERLDKDDEK